MGCFLGHDFSKNKVREGMWISREWFGGDSEAIEFGGFHLAKFSS